MDGPRKYYAKWKKNKCHENSLIFGIENKYRSRPINPENKLMVARVGGERWAQEVKGSGRYRLPVYTESWDEMYSIGIWSLV